MRFVNYYFPIPQCLLLLCCYCCHLVAICHVMWYDVMSCDVMWCDVMWCGVMWCDAILSMCREIWFWGGCTYSFSPWSTSYSAYHAVCHPALPLVSSIRSASTRGHTFPLLLLEDKRSLFCNPHIYDYSRDEDIGKLSSITHGYVGADLSALCKEAAINIYMWIYIYIERERARERCIYVNCNQLYFSPSFAIRHRDKDWGRGIDWSRARGINICKFFISVSITSPLSPQIYLSSDIYIIIVIYPVFHYMSYIFDSPLLPFFF